MAFEYESGPLSEVDTLDTVCDRGSVTDQVIEASGFDLDDNKKIRLGTGNDASIYYDGTNLVINPKGVGAGYTDASAGYLKCGNIGINTNPVVTKFLDVKGTLSNASAGLYLLNFTPTVTATAGWIFGINVYPTIILNGNDKGFVGVNVAGPSATYTGTNAVYKAFAADQMGVIGTLVDNYGLYLADFTLGTNNYAIRTGLGDVSLGDDLVLRNDSDKIYLGAAKDAYLEFDGDSLNVVANAITGTDDLNLTADDLNLNADLVFSDAKNVVFNTTTGTKIGTATNQKLAFYNVTPVDQPVTVTDAATQDLTGGDAIDKTKLEADLTSCKNAVNAVIDRLQELGLIA